MDTRFIMWIHPIIQLIATIAGFAAMYWGFRRFQMIHLKHKVMFPWKQHVRWGSIALLLWTAGLGLGLLFAHLGWGSILVTDIHYMIGFAVAPLCVTAYATGFAMDKYKKKRTLLNVVHGVNNLLLCLLICIQIVTGVWVIKVFLVY
ncbi:MAG: DUF4079 family protein [Halodesulfovibrio sp.]